MTRAKQAFNKHLKDKKPKEWYRKDEIPEQGSRQQEREKKRNIFKPRVLAKVSRDEECFVGSSIAVSDFLKPLCLHERILQFKPSLKQAIIKVAADENPTGWESTAFNNTDYKKEKNPCLSCQNMFRNLTGSIPKGRPDTILGGCAEYCPVNNLLPDEGNSEVLSKTMKKHMDQCKLLFESYADIHEECLRAYERYEESSAHVKKVCPENKHEGECAQAHDQYEESLRQLTEVYRDTKAKVHIFGYSPKCPIDLVVDDPS